MKVSAVSDLHVKIVDDQVLVHDVAGGKVHILNSGAGRILELCDGTRDIDDLAREFARDSAVDTETARRDVAAIVAEFEGLGLVAIRPS